MLRTLRSRKLRRIGLRRSMRDLNELPAPNRFSSIQLQAKPGFAGALTLLLRGRAGSYGGHPAIGEELRAVGEA